MNKDFWRGKRVFLTGHTGFKGAWLTLWLNKLGAQVCGYALEPPTQSSLFAEAGLEKQMLSVQGDVRDRDFLLQTIESFEPEIIFHLAAQPLVRESYRQPVETYAVNVMGMVHVLEALRHCPSAKAGVLITTDKCYENQEWFWGYRENEPLGGFDPYSSSKACAELVVSSYRRSFFSADGAVSKTALATARAGNVIGGGDWAEDRLVPDILSALESGKPIYIRQPQAIRPWQHVLEPLGGYLLLAEKLYQEGYSYAEAWNFGPEDRDACTVEKLASELCQQWGAGTVLELDRRPQPHEARYLKLDCSKAALRLGWRPRWGLSQALDATVTWTKRRLAGEPVQQICQEQIQSYMEA